MRRDRRPRVALVVETGLFREAVARALPRYGLAVVDRTAEPDVVLVDVTGSPRLAALRELAAQLSIAVTTENNHVHSILETLNVQRRGEVAWLVRSSGPRA
jgi:hypothetical protein